MLSNPVVAATIEEAGSQILHANSFSLVRTPLIEFVTALSIAKARFPPFWRKTAQVPPLLTLIFWLRSGVTGIKKIGPKHIALNNLNLLVGFSMLNDI